MAKVKAVSETAIIEVPVAEPDPATYIAREGSWLQVRLDREELAAFRRLHAGLLRDHAKKPDGRPVESKADVVRWVMRQLASLAAV